MQLVNFIIHALVALYAYCTDFVINVANNTGLSYYEVNFIFFIVLYPLLLTIGFCLYVFQRYRLHALRKKTK